MCRYLFLGLVNLFELVEVLEMKMAARCHFSYVEAEQGLGWAKDKMPR